MRKESTCFYTAGCRISPETEPDVWREKNSCWKSQYEKVERNKSSADTCHKEKVEMGEFLEQSIPEVLATEEVRQKGVF